MQLTNKSTVDFVDKLGTDLTVVNAARVSFDTHKDTFEPKDEKLLGYLAKHDHWSPFAHAQVQLRITAPIFVARQLVKHQIGLVWNEVSRRYVSDEPTFYVPTVWRGKPVDGAKQGSHGEIKLSKATLDRIDAFLDEADSLYEDLMHFGVCPEQARMLLPQNLMTSWYWTGSLYACARVCKLRLDSHSQLETTEVAVEIEKICREHFPNAWEELTKTF